MSAVRDALTHSAIQLRDRAASRAKVAGDLEGQARVMRIEEAEAEAAAVEIEAFVARLPE